ncbi:MAG: SusD/RagB family nutrient-binding outer membrane lipoprotein [Ferruginibacter sp.]|nr:SusD/RagB family nutrient-binding outer membrane lipoprotein [Cytophagales bacterium]
MKTLPKILLTGGLALSISSCETFTDGYNVSPNVPQNAPTDQLMTALLVSQGFVFSSELSRISAILTGQLTGSNRQYLALNSYLTDANDYDSPWENAYHLVGKQARLVQDRAGKEGNDWSRGIAQVVEAHTMGMATALWGDIPYSQAFDDVRFPAPAFDPQRKVYTLVQSQLDSGIRNLNGQGIALGVRDIFYGGDRTKWIAAARTLKARYYLHTGDYPAALEQARQGINANQDLRMPYAGTAKGLDMNPYFDFLTLSRPGDISAQGTHAVSLLQIRNNPRTDEIARARYFYALTPASANPNTGAKGFFAGDTDFPLITFEENQLILAEACLRTNQFAEALSALNTVRNYHQTNEYTSFGKPRYDAYQTADFEAGQLLNQAGSLREEALLKEILTEKYLSLIGQVEAFNDVRRARTLSGKRNVIGVLVKNSTAPGLPQRLLIPQSEINTNRSVDKNALPGLFDPTPVNQ